MSDSLSFRSESTAVEPESPYAVRILRRRWRDPRLWAGVALVAVSIVVGGQVLARSDDTVAMWQVTTTQRAGSALDPSALRQVDVHVGDDVAASYVTADTDLAGGLTLTHDLAPGELLAVADVTTEAEPLVELPLLVPASGVPADLGVGQRVDVWAVAGAERSTRAELVLDDVRVTTLGQDELAGSGADRAVSVALPTAADPGGVLEAFARGSVVLLRVGAQP